MKVDGQEIKKGDAIFGPFVIHRGHEVDKDGNVLIDSQGEPVKRLIAFFAQPVWSWDEFNEQFPRPEPKAGEVVFTKHGQQPDYDAPGYKQRIEQHNSRRWGFMILKSLEPSEVEFDNTSLTKPETWDQVEEILKRDEFSEFEFACIGNLIEEANGINSQKLEENKMDFLSRSKVSDDLSTLLSTDAATNS